MQFDLSHISINRDDLEFSLNDPIATQVHETDLSYQDMDARSFLNKTLLDAVKSGASDIHLEPYQSEYRIRYRIDGILRDITTPPNDFGQLLNIRLKVIGALDISEHKITQTGRFRMTLTPDFSVDFRVSITPTLHGETIVLRLLYLPEELLELENLGLNYDQIETIHQAIETMNGLILVSGPTGSGKTVTLYTLMKMLNNPERSIYTVEDPVEIHMNGINQVNINEKQGMNFASIAETLLRQDPDIIVIGEMRDKETVDTAIKAAHTGHLVLSTLHANDAAKVIPRLRNLNVDGYDIASTVHLIIAQRLVRKLDSDAKERYQPSPKELKSAGMLVDNITETAKTDDGETVKELYRARPSRKNPSGYRGREGIFQIVPMTKKLAQMVMDGATDIKIDSYCQAQGYKTLREIALEKVDKGITDLAEVIRVLGPARD